MPNLGGWELILVVLVIMVLFGAKRLPEASRSLGRSMRIFKAETKGLRDDSSTAVVHDPVAPSAIAPPTPVPAPTPVEAQAPLDAPATAPEQSPQPRP